jgi:hypothetical protein
MYVYFLYHAYIRLDLANMYTYLDNMTRVYIHTSTYRDIQTTRVCIHTILGNRIYVHTPVRMEYVYILL